MKSLNRLYIAAAAAVLICWHGAPARADSAEQGTLVRMVDGRVQLGATQSSRDDTLAEKVAAMMAALRPRGTDRVFRRRYENAQFPLLAPIPALAPLTTGTPQGCVVRFTQPDGSESWASLC